MDTLRVLANDGINPAGQQALEEAGFEVVTEKVAQEDLAQALQDFDAILVRSATKVRKELIDQCPRLKVIGRGGVGLDNIDVDYAQDKGLAVYNTPAASSQSVAELVFAHIFSIARFMHESNRYMPERGHNEFGPLKKSFSKGVELRGKSIAVIGFGRIGRAVARIAIGMGMNVMAVDPYIDEATIWIDLPGRNGAQRRVDVIIKTVPKRRALRDADVVTLHVPSQTKPLIGKQELEIMKESAILVNASRGGSVDEDALLDALEAGEISGAGLDVFANEPTPDARLLNHPRISVTPHIGASTGQAQANIGLELADKLKEHFGK